MLQATSSLLSNSDDPQQEPRKKKSIFSSLFPKSGTRHHSSFRRHSTSNELPSDYNNETNQDKTNINKIKIKEKDVLTLVNMGFSRDQVIQALIDANNNVQEAANTLISNQSYFNSQNY